MPPFEAEPQLKPGQSWWQTLPPTKTQESNRNKRFHSIMPQSDMEISCKSDNMVMGMNEEKDHSQITPTTYSFDPWDGEKSGTYLVCQKFQTSNLLISMLTILISCWKRNRGPESLGIYSTVRVSRIDQYASWSAIKPLGGSLFPGIHVPSVLGEQMPVGSQSC